MQWKADPRALDCPVDMKDVKKYDFASSRYYDWYAMEPVGCTGSLED